MNGTVRVLLVEDDPGYARLLREILSQPSDVAYALCRAATLAEGLQCLEDGKIDVTLLDLGLPDADGIEAVTEVCSKDPRMPIVVLSGQADVTTALESMRIGAQEYLVKGQADHLLVPRAIRYAMERKRIQDFEPLLFGIVGHDLRNPLQAIAVLVQSLRRDSTLGAEQKKKLERIASASSRANVLVHDLLDLARLRLVNKVLPIDRKETDLGPVVREVIEEFRLAHGPEAVIYEEGTDARGEFDPARIAQVMANLIRNARDHGDREKPIRVGLRAGPSRVEIEVHNDGPPIPAEFLPHLFEPLRRAAIADGARENSRGIGLGLYIVHEIVTAHGGEIRVHSSESAGTTILIGLPTSSAATA